MARRRKYQYNWFGRTRFPTSMSDKNIFDRYLLALRKTPSDDRTEHTGRSALENLLQEIAKGVSHDLVVHQETKQKKVKDKSSGVADVEKRGAPDFKVTKKGAMVVGYVENKAIGENLTKVLKSDQIAKYKTLSDNIVLTDYLQFVWINKYGPLQSERLCDESHIEHPKFHIREDRAKAVRKLLEGFFSTAPEGIGRAQQLALALATRSKLLRDYLGEELVRQEREHKEGRLYGLFQIFRDQVFHELTPKEFADAFAQMLAYGLFLARLNSDSQPVTLDNARQYVPGSFQLSANSWSFSLFSITRSIVVSDGSWKKSCPSSTDWTYRPFIRTCHSGNGGQLTERSAPLTRKNIDCSSAIHSSTSMKIISRPTTQGCARAGACTTRRRRS
jgi:hypothetical protein